jgi:hypothetical protein
VPIQKVTVMTRTMRAWKKANAYVRSGQHEKAIYWLSRVQEILDAGPPKPARFRAVDAGYMASAAFLLALLCAAYYAP